MGRPESFFSGRLRNGKRLEGKQMCFLVKPFFLGLGLE